MNFSVKYYPETLIFLTFKFWVCPSQWPSGLKRRSTATRLLRLWVLIPPGAWMFVCCECCVLSGSDLCDEMITRPEESYWLWCAVVCDLETSWMRRSWPTGGYCAKKVPNLANMYYPFLLILFSRLKCNLLIATRIFFLILGCITPRLRIT